ncbi:DUF429 domain-containing protein [Actinacidiphila glaucinigra]|uniref:DUF429 domain-containing protein n=1 Tax=Actinacidiphila glaucinigra TaxID=235986 RepID=UPI002DD9F137|nr:DUF429 domain-containing protein [Actinacidiphila glaucinigra]WSD60752.1 DUF429 domain-containing protein [Actinacidiphila glaucinigra]
MRTLGIDLAAGPRTTAAAVVDWPGDGTAVVAPPLLGCADDVLVDLLSGLEPEERAGVDCPFGWPIPFVEAVTAHTAGAPWPGRGTDSAAHRATLRHRRTDILTHEELGGRWPLSVAFDRLGATAARWAHLADELAARGRPVARDGSGRIAEVYPAASRRRWGLGPERSMAELRAAAPWLRCGPAERAAYDGSEHAFDALIAALAARAVERGLTRLPSGPEQTRAAAVEGWIHVPHAATLPSLP